MTLEIRDHEPERIAGLHPLWQKAMERCKPWTQVEDGRWVSSTCISPYPVFIYDSCGSTMELLDRLRKDGQAADWTSVLAAEQTAGRGQRKRIWMSPPGNLYAAWHWPVLREELLSLPPYIIALGLSEVLESRGLRVQFKWPNDILIEGRKAAGVLITQTGGESIIGVGVNLAWAPADRVLAVMGAPAATSLSDLGVFADPFELWLEILQYTKGIFDFSSRQILSGVEKRLAWIGQSVKIVSFGNDPDYIATLVGLAKDGALLVEVKGQSRRVYSASLAPVARL